MNAKSSHFFPTVKSLVSWRKPWLWLALLLAIYSLTVGVIAPRVLERQLQSLMRERLQLELSVEKLAINPFTLQLRALNLQVQGGALEEPLGFGELRVNFQLSSLLRRAWRFQEVYLLGLYGDFRRHADGSSNFSRLGDIWLATATPDEPEENAEESSSALPRLFIADLQLNIARVQIEDQVPATPFTTQVGPLTLNIDHLSTLPEDKGRHTLKVQTPTGMQLTWQGDIRLNPVASQGTLEFSGAVFPLVANYLQDRILFAIPSGDLRARFDYELIQNADDARPWQVAINALAVQIQQLQLQHKNTQAPLFSLPVLAIENGSLLWPQQKVELPVIELREGKVWPVLQSNGQLNFAQLLVPDGNPPTTTEETSTAAPWTVDAPAIRLKNWEITWHDQTLKEPATLPLKDIQLEILGFSTHPETRIQLQSQLVLGNGKVTVTGSLQPVPLANLDLDFQISDLPLTLAQPYVAEQARVTLADGTANASGKIRGVSLEAIILNGRISADKLQIEEQAEAKRILGWTQLALEDMTLNTQPPLKLAIKRIVLRQPYVDFAIAVDGTHTLNRVLNQKESAPPADTAAPSPEPEIQIGSIQIEDGGALFSDASLPLPFSTKIQNLNGTVSALDSSSSTPAKMALKGQVGEYGQVQIDGQLLPMKPEENTQVELLFENIEIPDFSPYSVKFAAREIASGKLDLDLKYQVKNSRMQGENTMVLHDFALGKKVDHPGAMDLPLDLAVALLKDSSGRISLDLPISGDMNDPQFSYGAVIGQALRKVLTSLVSSPFRLLGKLAGSDSEQFGRVVFTPGSPEVSPPQQEKLHQLAAVLQKRPDLQLEIPAGFSATRDTAPLQAQQFLQRAQTQLKEELDLLNPRHLKVLEKWYETQHLNPTLSELRAQSNGKAASESDPLAYGTALQAALIKAEVLPENALENLGLLRRSRIHEILLAAAPELEKRITLTPGGDMPGKEKEKKVYVELGLETR